MSFLHGIEIKEDDSGPRPIASSNSAVIGVVGTVAGDFSKFPADVPVLIAGSRKDAERYGLSLENLEGQPPEETKPATKPKVKQKAEGEPDTATDVAQGETLPLQDPSGNNTTLEEDTLRYAINGILEQTGAMIVAVRAADKTEANIINAIGALKGAESVVGQCPRILIAPGFSDSKLIRDKLGNVAEAVRGIAVIDGNDDVVHTNVATDIKDNYSDSRTYAVYPHVKVSCGEKGTREEPASARVAGVIAKSDTQRGFWFSPSNQVMKGIVGTKYPIDFALDSITSTANQLNNGNVATIIQQNGYRLWGNRSCASDAKWQFISVRRTADMINDALLRSHLWAVDRNITKTYVEDVTEGVNAYLRHLKNTGAIINGKCWADIDKNTPDQIVQGKIVFSFDFTPPYPAEHITFNSRLVNDYLVEIFA